MKKILDELEELNRSEYDKIKQNLRFYPDCANFFKYYKEGIFTQEKIDAINLMIDKNPNALKYMNFGLFQDEIFEAGPEFCEYISKFPSIAYQLITIKEHNPQMLTEIINRSKGYDDLKNNLEELEILITYAAKNVFELKDEKINIEEFLECAYRDSRALKLINVKYGKDYRKRLNEKLETGYEKAKDFEEKLNVLLNKNYSVSLTVAKNLLKDFGSDLENLENLSPETKAFFGNLEKILQINDESQIDKLFKENSSRISIVELQKMKKKIQTECAKEFSKEFKSTDEQIKKEILQGNLTTIEFEGKKIQQIKLNGKFNLLLHSTDTNFLLQKEKIEDLKEFWINGTDKKNHVVSTTYINQDMLGTAPVGENGVRYAFCDLNSDDIKLMGVTDLNTMCTEFAYDSKKKQYMSAKTLAYNTRRVYSEFGIEKNIPNYIVIFDDDSEKVIENSYKAASQFEIPVIYMDKAEIEQTQIQNLEALLEEFKNTKDIEVLQRLINTYETNVSGWLLNRSEENDESFTKGIDNSRFKDDFKKIQTEIEEVSNLYLSMQNENQITENEITNVIKIFLKEIELYENSQELMPISKTQITYDVKKILETANASLENMGRTELKVDLDNIPTSKEYSLQIKDFVKNGLSGENAVTITDYQEAKKELENEKEIKNKGSEIDE